MLIKSIVADERRWKSLLGGTRTGEFPEKDYLAFETEKGKNVLILYLHPLTDVKKYDGDLHQGLQDVPPDPSLRPDPTTACSMLPPSLTIRRGRVHYEQNYTAHIPLHPDIAIQYGHDLDVITRRERLLGGKSTMVQKWQSTQDFVKYAQSAGAEEILREFCVAWVKGYRSDGFADLGPIQITRPLSDLLYIERKECSYKPQNPAFCMRLAVLLARYEELYEVVLNLAEKRMLLPAKEEPTPKRKHPRTDIRVQVHCRDELEGLTHMNRADAAAKRGL